MSNQYGLPPRQQQDGWPAQPPPQAQPNPSIGYYSGGFDPRARQAASPRRKRRRVFLWVFLAIQAIFVLWLVAGLATTHTGPTHAELASACYNHNWWPVFKSQSDCVTHFGGALQAAGNVGKGLGAAVIVIFWVVVDIIMGISYGVYKLATRDRYR